MNNIKFSKCPLCFYSCSFRLKYDFGEHKIYECKKCKFKYLSPQPNIEELKKLYNSDSYFKNINFYKGHNLSIFGYADYFAEKFNKQHQFRKIALKLKKLLIKSNMFKFNKTKLLEIGCGPGFFLKEAAFAGFKCQGVEFNKNIISKLNKYQKIPIKYANYENIIDHEKEKFHAIVILDVIEHFQNPFKVFENIYNSLLPGGILVISTIDSDSFMSKIIGKRLEDFRRFREHLFFFDRNNLQNLLNRLGFKIIYINFWGHTFRFDHLASRIGLISPLLKIPFILLFKIFKSLPSKSIYINPGTKIIIYAIKK